MHVEVKREMMIPSPAPHIGCYAWNPAYTSRDGLGMVMSLVRKVSQPGQKWRQWTSSLHRMASGDNGATWKPTGESAESGNYASGNQRLAWCHFLDPDNGMLLSMSQTSWHRSGGEMSADHGYGARQTALHYQVSKDGGKSWTPPRQVIVSGGQYDENHWMPGIMEKDEQFLSVDQGPFLKLEDGTILFGINLQVPSKYYPEKQMFSAAFLRGRWRNGGPEMDWDVSDVIRVPKSASLIGVDEPDLLHLGGQRVLTTLRCEGDEERNIPSTRQWAISEDGGRTWSKPQPLKYDDGSMVWVPASPAAFERDPATGKAYWFSDILEKPVTGQLPRYPLCMAEFDTERICLIKDSLTVLQGLPPGAPEGRNYTNFGHYVDRVTGEFVLLLMEWPKVNEDELTADTIRLRVRVNGKA